MANFEDAVKILFLTNDPGHLAKILKTTSLTLIFVKI